MSEIKTSDKHKIFIQYIAITISILTIFYYAVVEKANFNNNMMIQSAKIEQLENDIEKMENSKVDNKIFEMIIDDIQEIKSDIKEIKNKG